MTEQNDHGDHSKRNEPLAGADLERYTRKTRRQVRLAQRACRRRKSWLDRLVTGFLERATRPKSPADDFMRDDLVDAGISFGADELDAYQSGDEAPEGRA